MGLLGGPNIRRGYVITLCKMYVVWCLIIPRSQSRVKPKAKVEFCAILNEASFLNIQLPFNRLVGTGVLAWKGVRHGQPLWHCFCCLLAFAIATIKFLTRMSIAVKGCHSPTAWSGLEANLPWYGRMALSMAGTRIWLACDSPVPWFWHRETYLTWILQVSKICAFSPEKATKTQTFYISWRSRYVFWWFAFSFEEIPDQYISLQYIFLKLD